MSLSATKPLVLSPYIAKSAKYQNKFIAEEQRKEKEQAAKGKIGKKITIELEPDPPPPFKITIPNSSCFPEQIPPSSLNVSI